MRVRVKVNTQAAIKLGREPRGEEHVEVDLQKLTPEQLEELAHTEQDGSGSSRTGDTLYLPGGEATEEAVASYLSEKAATRRQDEEAHRLKVEKTIVEFLTMKQEEFNMKVFFTNADYEAVADPRLAERMQARNAWEAEQAAEKEAEQRRLEVLRAEVERKADEENARRADEAAAWIAEHGSERLKLAHQGGYKCTRLYLQERVALELGADWGVDTADRADWEEKVNPSLEALQMVRDLPEGYEGEVVWLTEGTQRDEYGFLPCEALKVRLPYSRHVALRAM